METLSDLYHHQADELFDKAARAPSPEIREALLRAAMACKHLAEDAEKDDRNL